MEELTNCTEVEKIERDFSHSYEFFYIVKEPLETQRVSEFYPRREEMLKAMCKEKDQSRIEGTIFSPCIRDCETNEYAAWGDNEMVLPEYLVWGSDGREICSCFTLNEALEIMHAYGKGTQVENRQGTLIYGIAQ